VFLTLGLFIASLCLLGYGIKNARVKRQILASIIDSVISLFLMLILRLLQLAAYSYFQFAKQEGGIINSIIDPLSGAVIPLALLLAIHAPLSAMTAKCTQWHSTRHPVRVDDITLEDRTRHYSSEWSVINMPSGTTFYNPSHSSDESLERVPLAQAKHDNYGSNV